MNLLSTRELQHLQLQLGLKGKKTKFPRIHARNNEWKSPNRWLEDAAKRMCKKMHKITQLLGETFVYWNQWRIPLTQSDKENFVFFRTKSLKVSVKFLNKVFISLIMPAALVCKAEVIRMFRLVCDFGTVFWGMKPKLNKTKGQLFVREINFNGGNNGF